MIILGKWGTGRSPGKDERMKVTGELVGRTKRGHLADLFDDGKAKAIVPGVLFSLIEAGKHPSGIQRHGQAGIADAQAAGFQRDGDVTLRDIVVAGVAE